MVHAFRETFALLHRTQPRSSDPFCGRVAMPKSQGLCTKLGMANHTPTFCFGLYWRVLVAIDCETWLVLSVVEVRGVVALDYRRTRGTHMLSADCVTILTKEILGWCSLPSPRFGIECPSGERSGWLVEGGNSIKGRQCLVMLIMSCGKRLTR
jgi:hypothetical protein